jgi:hypothetical protein
LSPFSDTLTGREAPPLLALRRITDHHLEALRAGKTGTAGALTGPAAGSYHAVAAWVLLPPAGLRALWRSTGPPVSKSQSSGSASCIFVSF